MKHNDTYTGFTRCWKIK